METEPFDFESEAADVLRRAVQTFAAWVADNYQMTEAEACTLTNPTEAPAAYARGYNEALRAIPDALDLWMDGRL